MKSIKFTDAFALILACMSMIAVGCSSDNPVKPSTDLSSITMSADYGAKNKLEQISGSVERVDIIEHMIGLVNNSVVIAVDKDVKIRYNNTIQTRGSDLSNIKIGDGIIAYGYRASKRIFKATYLDIYTSIWDNILYQ